MIVPACAERERDSTATAAEFLEASSDELLLNIGDALGEAREGRFLEGGSYILILDSFAPHLKLFRSDGTLLWSGAEEGDGPKSGERETVRWSFPDPETAAPFELDVGRLVAPL